MNIKKRSRRRATGGKRFTPDEVREIRRRYRESLEGATPGLTYMDLALEKRVSYQTIHSLVRRKTYRDVDDLFVAA